MNFVVDECVNRSLIEALRKLEHGVIAIKEISPGLDDVTVLAFSYRNGAVLLTDDYDYGDLIFKDGQQAHGVVIFEPALLERADEEFAMEIAERLTERADQWVGYLTIMDSARLRPRALPNI